MDHLINTNRKRIKKTTSEQFDLMIREMSQRPYAARGYAFGFRRDKVDADWREIVVQLNNIGPPMRNISGWKKVWTDYRTRLRNRLKNIKAARPKVKKLCYFEELILKHINDTGIVPATIEHPPENDNTSSSIKWQESGAINQSYSSQEGYVCPDIQDQGHDKDNNETERESSILGYLSNITNLLEMRIVAIEQQIIQMKKQNFTLKELLDNKYHSPE